jgi:late competence protein required for DNA uptake (superfamily II DNA/RNA helicase)
MDMPILKDCVLLAARRMICRDVCNFPFSSKKVTAQSMYIQWIGQIGYYQKHSSVNNVQNNTMNQ